MKNMLEDSISCSPGNDKKKSRLRRFHKKGKRKSEPSNVPASENVLKSKIPNLEAIYEEPTLNTTNFDYFNPFENENLLAAADKFEASTSSTKLKNLTSKGFVRLDNLPVEEEDTHLSITPPEPPLQSQYIGQANSPRVLGPETQFGITESEFVRFCDEAETEVLTQQHSDVPSQKPTKSIVDAILHDFCLSQSENDVATKTPTKSKPIVDRILADFCSSPTESEIEAQTANSAAKTTTETKSIVDEILEDFCGSPSCKSSPNPNSNDSTPIFRFKSQYIRTYSRLGRKRRIRRNIGTELNVVLPEADGNASDSSSGLSVQEDLSQSVEPQLDTVDLNKSVKLCENLLNLSSYFSQTQSTPNEQNSPMASQRSNNLRLSELVEEIIKIKPKKTTLSRHRSEDEFRGFPDYESDSKESTLKELLEDEDDDDVLQQVNCDSLCYIKSEPKMVLTSINTDLEKTLKDASAVIERAKKLMFIEHDQNTNTHCSTNEDQQYCDKFKYIVNKSSTNSSVKDEQIFDDADIWNDNECLLNYKTQKRSELAESDPFNDILCKPRFYTNRAIYTGNDCETKTIDTETSNCDIKKDFVEISDCERLGVLQGQNRYHEINDPCSSSSVRPSSALTRSKLTSYGAIHNTHEGVANDYKESLQDKNLNEFDASKIIGFKTASKKSISISDIARQKANEFLRNIEQEEHEEDLKKNKSCDVSPVSGNFIKIDRKEDKQEETAFSSGFARFSTASKKTISISSEAKRKAEELLKKFEKEESEKDLKIDQEQYDFSTEATKLSNISTPPCFAGFSTASKKSISISNEAKQRADDFLKKFQQEENEKDMILCKNKDNNEDNSNVSAFDGFSTASKKPIPISMDAKLKADEILNKFEEAERENLKTKEVPIMKLTQRHPDEISEEVRRKAQELLLDIEFFEEAFEDELKEIEARPMSQFQNQKQTAVYYATSESSKLCIGTTKEHNFEGFTTASKKSINVSYGAIQHAEQLLKTVHNEDLPKEFLNCIESELNGAIDSKRNPVSPGNEPYNDVKSEANQPLATNDSKIHRRCITPIPEQKFNNQEKSDLTNDQACARNEIGEENVLNPLESERSKNIARKRKYSESQIEEKGKSPLNITPRRLSCVERTPLNRIENAPVHKTSSAPHKESTPSSVIISRKNLLSLSKRRKTDSPGQLKNDNVNGPKTPEKQQPLSILQCNANSTPNLKEFFDSVSTSTPRLIRKEQPNKINENSSKDALLDPDFRKIQWEDSSIRINRTTCVTDANVTFSQVSPSPKERIELLKMYGEPPAISPILMVNKCRASGLRRGRSLMKH